MNLVAKDVYILMEKEYRISRNIRAEWYLKRINSYISINRRRSIKDYTGELEVLSVIPENPPHEWDYDTAHEYQYLVTEKTQLSFLSRKYNFVFCLDFSPSLASGCYDGDLLYFDSMFKALEKCLRGIVKPFNIPGCELLFYPKIYVTVIGHVPFFKSAQQQVLVQGYLLVSEKKAIHDFLKDLRKKISQLQTRTASLTIQTPSRASPTRVNEYLKPRHDDTRLSKPQSLVSPDVGFMSIVQQGILALHLLPENSMSGIIIVTDGVLSLPDATIFDTLLAQLRNLTISCSFIQLTGAVSHNLGLGYVPFSNLMAFLANATFGAFFKELPVINDDYENGMNIYHHALLTWGLQKANRRLYCEESFATDWSAHDASQFDTEMFGLLRKKEWCCTVKATLNAVLSCRLREGYTVKDAVVSNSEILVVLVLRWKYNISIEYHVRAKLPLNQIGMETEVWVEASYEFLNDIQSGDTGSLSRSSYRQKMVRKYWNTMRDLQQSDILLAGLQSFSSVPANYALSDCFKKGQPVFCINSETNAPEPICPIHVPHFASYWKPVCMLNISKWQKWMHTHRISLVLEYDLPLSKNLHVTNRSGRYGVVQCRQAEITLTSYITGWTDFILIENHSYIKFIYDMEDGGGPISFVVVRITSNKPPCITLRLAFLGGTSGRIRHRHVQEFRDGLVKLTLKPKEAGMDCLKCETDMKSDIKDRCCKILNKPIEKILIWYDRIPQNLMSSQIYDLSSRSSRSIYGQYSTIDKSAINNHLILSRYLHHRRWIWGVQKSSSPPISKSIINKILNVLTKIRLLDGFKFTYSCNGIINLSKEYKVKLDIDERIPGLKKHFNSSDLSSYCVVQFVIFPPISTTSKVNFVEDSDDSDSVEIEGETQLVTECWIEPQNGELLDAKCNYKELGQSIFVRDEECVWSLVAFECLIQLSSHPTTSNNQLFDDVVSKDNPATSDNQAIQKHFFSPNFVSLFDKSRQAELLLSTLVQDCNAVILNKPGNAISDDANSTYCDILLDNLDKLHEGRSLLLTSKDCFKFPSFIQKRQRKSSKETQSPFLNFDDENKSLAKWRCFIRFVSQTQVIATVVPASYADLKSLFLTATNLRDESSFSVRLISDPSEITNLEAIEVQNQELMKQRMRHHGTDSSESFGRHSNSMSVRIGSEMPERSHSLIQRQSTSASALPTGRGDSPRVRYKSGPAQSDSDNLQPCRRERASSLYSNQESSKQTKPVKPHEAQKKNEPAGNASRKRNVSMPAKAHQEMTATNNFKCVSMETMKDEFYPSRVKHPGDVTSGSSFSFDSDTFHQDSVMILGSVVLPIYMYDCRLPKVIDQLITRCNRTNIVGEDIIVNSTFTAAEEKIVSEVRRTSNIRVRKRSQKMESSSQSSETNSELLLAQVVSVEICQRQAFVGGVFKALTKNLYVHGPDVSSAMDQCQEIVVEIDMTDYLKVVCVHLKDFMLKNSSQEIIKNEINENERSTTPDGGATYSFPMTFLVEYMPCEEISSVHQEIRYKFEEILQGSFKAVPNLRDYYYYTPEFTQSMRSRKKKKSGESSLAGDDDIMFISNEEDGEMTSVPFYSHRKLASQLSSASQFSNVTFDREDCASSKSLEDSLRDCESPPLFLHMTCSIKVANQLIATTPISSFPTCFADIAHCLDESPIDIEKLNVTFDVLCLSLANEQAPEESEIDESAKNYPFESSVSRDEDPEFLTYALQDPDMQLKLINRELSTLPSHQREAIIDLCDQIKWLLRNEIISSKLQTVCITKPILTEVLDHVLLHNEAQNCIIDNIPLNFIYGVEESLEKFHDELRKQCITGYQFIYEEDLVYIATDQQYQNKGWTSLIPSGFPGANSFDDKTDEASMTSGSSSLVEAEPKKLTQKVSFESDGNSANSENTFQETTKELDTQSESNIHEKPSVPATVSSDNSHTKDDAMNSDDYLQELASSQPPMPDFWIIVKITTDFAIVHYHHRNVSGIEKWKEVFNDTIHCIKNAVKLVNQKLLLQDLADTLTCNYLLEPESRDDLWKKDDQSADEEYHGGFLEAEMKFRPGSFSCPRIWSATFELHPRAKSGGGRTGISGLHVLRTCLKPFAVQNRRNMFVYKDTSGVGTNIFYLRLDEKSSDHNPLLFTDARKDDSSMSRSSIIPLIKRATRDDDSPASQNELRPRVSSFGEKDVIVEGLQSTNDQKKNKDFIVLSVHGVEMPGPSIKEELVQMLQKKLDDAVLDAIFVMLFKNPRHKLSPEDVHFIQRPSQLPSDILRFFLNKYAVRHLQAYSCYLKQNMYSCGFTEPKYADSKTCYQFQDFSATDQEPGSDPTIFLYVCSKKEGTKGAGVACIAFSIIDASGNSIQNLGSWTDYDKKEPLGSRDCEEITETFQCGTEENETKTCEAMLQFKIWESGRLDMSDLTKSLTESIRNSLWDLAMEYYFLTTPITGSENGVTSNPPTDNEGTSTPKTQELIPPGTPTPIPNTNVLLPKVNEKKRRASVPVHFDRRAWIEQQIQGKPSPKSPFKVGSGRHSFDFGKQPLNPADTQEKTESYFSPVPEDSINEGLQILNDTYSDFIVNWLEFGCSLGAPSVRKHSVKCPTKKAVYTFVSELQTCLNAHLNESTRIFQKDDDASNHFVEVTSLPTSSPSSNPMQSLSDIIIISFCPDHEMPLSSQQNIHELSSALNKGKKNKRFEPTIISYSSNLESSTESCVSTATPFAKCKWNATQPYFIRRQICFVAVMSKGNLTIYMYNWVKELCDMLVSFFSTLVQWTTARNRLLSSLVLQKMGIFHNQPFTRKEIATKGDKKEEKNPYVQSMNYVENLIKHTAPTKEIRLSGERAARKNQITAPIHILTNLYKNSIPPKLGSFKGDFLYHQGKQMIEIYRTLFQKERENWVLQTIMQTQTTSQVFTAQRLAIFKKHSRQSHFCLTPLLFLPKWRRQIAAICDHFAVDTTPTKNVSPLSIGKESRSRHSSGNMKLPSHTELRRSSSIGISGNTSPYISGSAHLVMGDDKWYDALCLNYLKEYIQYLESLGFSLVTVRQEVDKKKNVSKDIQNKIKMQDTKVLNSPSYLLKNVRGGTMLIRINFLEPFFSTTIFSLEYARLVKEVPSSIQCIVPSEFLDQVDMHKVLLHMHSFTFDYHLRSVCDSVANRQLLFTSGFNFSSLLSDFMKYYRKSPNFARNLIHQGDLRVTDIGTTGDHLYNYVLARERQYDMNVLRMNPVDISDDLQAEFALVYNRACNFSLTEEPNEEEINNYECTLLICHHPFTNDRSYNVLNLKYFVILTSKREVYPSRFNSRMGRFRTVSTADYRRSSSMSEVGDPSQLPRVSFSGTSSDSTHSEDISDPSKRDKKSRASISKELPEIRQESVNYLGFFSAYEMAMQEILRKQTDDAETRIRTMFNTAKIHCRRDSLWQKLLNHFNEEDLKNKKEQMNILSFNEATELISLVHVQTLTDFDHRFTFLEQKGIPWYQNLIKVLQNKYQDKSRLLQANDNGVQLLILFNQLCPDVCMMLSVNLRREQAEMCCLRKHLPTEIPSRKLSPVMKTFLEDIVNCICFHLWTGLI